ncbi:reverse transcriptase domain-containing protein [Artemisia annua]|uniref:Reverse transcriptase domain-containing protein n=1 Tax=Artemisia annua TaxID=35608 RepID=A0A2U1K8K8_ARTAN|nr:reverse transcriptase domain-containing protein [Artemisia annua]
MEYRPAHFKAPERMTTPTINQGIRQGVIPNGNNQKRKLTEIGTINPIYCNFANAQDCYRKHLGDRINYHRQLGCKQKINRNYLVTSVTENGYRGKQPLCQKCQMHHTGICIAKCSKCWKIGHKTSGCKAPDRRRQTATVVCHGCGAKGHYKNQCPNYNINWKAKTFARE